MKSSDIFFKHHLAQTTMFPFALEIEKAEGIYLIDRDGRRYMDMISGIGVNNLGHGNGHINAALKKQIDQHLHVMVYGEYLQEAQKKAASLLTALLPPALDTCYFVNSGTEANEAALKLAKRVTGRTKIISFKGAYHGNTHGSLSVSGNEMKKYAFRPLLPDVHFLTFNDPDDLEKIDNDTACVIMETIQGDAGVRIPSIPFFKKLREQCDRTGSLLILDEIQCGMGRTGSMFAFEQFGIQPDILTLGKALAGGLPVGCTISSRKNMEMFTHDPMLGHISTFAGHPLICAGVAATLEVYKINHIVDYVNEKGKQIATRLAHHLIREIRYRGLFFAIEMESAEIVQAIVEKCLEKGLVSFWFLSCPNAFRIAPPLNITDEEIKIACDIVLQSMNEISTHVKS